jgi:transposase
MAFIRGEHPGQVLMFPPTLDELIPADHLCRVIALFLERIDMQAAGFLRAEPADTGRPGYNPRDLLGLLLYGCTQQTRSSRRLEAETHRNVEVMWLLQGLRPDHKSIAEFRRWNARGIAAVGGEFLQFARAAKLIHEQWSVIDGSKFAAASSKDAVRERETVARYLEQLEKNDADEEPEISRDALAAAIEWLQQHPEPQASFMKTAQGKVPAYNVQIAVEAENHLIVAHEVTTDKNDSRSLLPMAQAAREAVGAEEQEFHAVADAGYRNADHAGACEAAGIITHVPVPPSTNPAGDGTHFPQSQFEYNQSNDTYRCPAGKTLARQRQNGNEIRYLARPEDCAACPLKNRCTDAAQRMIKRHRYQSAVERMGQRATPETMRLRKRTVEHPFAFLKYRVFGHPRFLLRGLRGARTEISLAVLAYNFKRLVNVLGAGRMMQMLAT